MPHEVHLKSRMLADALWHAAQYILQFMSFSIPSVWRLFKSYVLV
jgi:hypothetical protein